MEIDKLSLVRYIIKITLQKERCITITGVREDAMHRGYVKGLEDALKFTHLEYIDTDGILVFDSEGGKDNEPLH